jgi:Spy/CpxP family protein refolding chaperone
MKCFKALIVPMVLLLPALAIAQPMGGRGSGCDGPSMGPKAPRHQMMKPGARGAMFMQMADKLDLTDDQKAKMEKVRTDFQLMMVDQQAKIRKAQIQLRVLMHDEKAAVTAVEAQIDQVAKWRAEGAKLRYRHHAEMQSVLTDKQKEMLKELRKERPGERHGMMFPGDVDGDDDAPEPDGEEG